MLLLARSEERRVGKECRFRGLLYTLKEKPMPWALWPGSRTFTWSWPALPWMARLAPPLPLVAATFTVSLPLPLLIVVRIARLESMEKTAYEIETSLEFRRVLFRSRAKKL